MLAAGVNVQRVHALEDVRFIPYFDVPLNSRFNGIHNLNTVGGLRSYLDSNSGSNFIKVATEEGMMPANFAQTALSRPDREMLPYGSRYEMFRAALSQPEVEAVADPDILLSLRAGQTVELPMHLDVRPPDSASMPLRKHAFAEFEETAHLFQFLNGGPLSRTGLKVADRLAQSDLKLTYLGVHAGGPENLIVENDVIGMLRELGLRPPAFMMNQAPAYARQEITRLGL